MFGVGPTFQTSIDRALTVILLIVSVQLLTSRFFLFDVTGGDFVESGQDLGKSQNVSFR